MYRLYDIPCQKRKKSVEIDDAKNMMITKKKKNRMKKIMIAALKKRKIIKAIRFPKLATNKDQLHH